MVKKKWAAVFLALCIALSIPHLALATDNDDSPVNVMTNETEATEIIPVSGYIGADVIVIDPEDPGTIPETEIYV